MSEDLGTMTLVLMGLVKLLRELFTTYGISEKLASDGGAELTSYEAQQLLRSWGYAQTLVSGEPT